MAESGGVVRLVLKRGIDVVVDENVREGSLKNLLVSKIRFDEQLEINGLAFFPQEDLMIHVYQGHYRLTQSLTRFTSGEATSPIVFTATPRSKSVSDVPNLMNLDIVQLESLNPLVSGRSAFPIVKRPERTVYQEGKSCFSDIFKYIKRCIRHGYKVSHAGRVFTLDETLSAKAAEDSWSIASDKTDQLIPVHLFFELDVEVEFIYVDNSVFENELASVIKAFCKSSDWENADPETRALYRRTSALSRFGIIWVKGLHEICSITDLPVLLKMVQTELPFGPVIEDIQENLEQFDLKQCLSDDPSLRSIASSLVTAFGNYFNPQLNEANLNTKLWTPILDTLLIPNRYNRKGRLNSVVEYYLKAIKGNIRDLRIDYALLGENVYPVLMAEYAAKLLDRSVSKDFTKLAIAMASFLLEYISKHKDEPELLKLLKGFLLYISATQMELAILRPLFDRSMRLKGFALKTDKNWIFDLQRANPQRELNVVIEFAPCDSYTFSVEDKERILRQIETKLKGLELPRVEVEGRSVSCPKAIDLSCIDFNAIKFIRGIGLYLHGYVDELLELNVRPPSNDGQYVYSIPLQKSDYTQAIPEAETPLRKQNSTFEDFETPGGFLNSPLSRKRKKTTRKSLLILQEKYGYEAMSLAKIRKTRNGAIIKTRIPGNLRARFALKAINEDEWHFLRKFAVPLADVIPKLAVLERFQKEELMLVGSEGHRSLKHQFVSDGGIATSWMFAIPQRVGALLVDIILAIDKLSQEGLVHNDISLTSVIYSKLHHHWVLKKFSQIQPIQVNRGLSPQSDLKDLAGVAEWIVEVWGNYQLKLSDTTVSEYFGDKYVKLREFLDFLKMGPSIPEALDTALRYYEPYKRCCKIDVKFNKLRFRRLRAAIKQYLPAAPAQLPIIKPIPMLISEASALKRPASAMATDDQENLSGNTIVLD